MIPVKVVCRQLRDPNNVTLRLFLVAMCAIGPLTILANTPIADAVKVSLVVSVQICAGSFFWRLLRKNSILAVPELLGIGMSLGTFLSLISGQLLRTTPLAKIGWILPGIVLSIVLTIKKFRPNFIKPTIEQTPRVIVIFLSISLLVSLTYWWWWLWPIVLIPACICFQWFKSTNQRATFTKTVVLIASSIGLIIYSIELRNLNLSWWIFSNDQVFSESLSTSLTVWGRHENIQLVGGSITYHWFALAWAGMTTQAVGVGPWVVVTKALPICAMLGAICLVWSSTVLIAKNKIAASISVAFFVLGSNSFGITPTKFFHSPTYLFSIIWILGFTYVLFVKFHSHVSSAPIILGLLFAASFGGKATNGPIAVAGVLLCLILTMFRCRKKLDSIFLLETLACMVIAGIFVYKIEYRSSFTDIAAQANNFGVGFGEIGAHLGIANWDSSSLIRSIAFISVMAGLLSTIAPILLLLLKPELRGRHELFYFIGIAISALVGISIFTHGGAAQLFFFLAGLSILPIGIGWGLADSWLSTDLRTNRNSVVLPILFGFFGTLLSRFLWSLKLTGVDAYKSSFILKFISQFILWGFATLILIFFSNVRTRDTSSISKTTRYYLATLVLVSSSFSFGIIQRVENAVRLKNIDDKTEQSADVISGSTDLVAALTWLREFSNEDDIVATNRYCIPNVDPCSPRWFLVSAISRRRMLIEGGYAFNLSPDREERRKFSLQFAENGDHESAIWLKRNHVKWVFVDHSVQISGMRSWEPYGVVRFHNTGASVIELR